MVSESVKHVIQASILLSVHENDETAFQSWHDSYITQVQVMLQRSLHVTCIALILTLDTDLKCTQSA